MVRKWDEIDMKRCDGSDVTCHSSHTASSFWLKCRVPPFSISCRDFSRDFPTVKVQIPGTLIANRVKKS